MHMALASGNLRLQHNCYWSRRHGYAIVRANVMARPLTYGLYETTSGIMNGKKTGRHIELFGTLLRSVQTRVLASSWCLLLFWG
jgi:hypothetical protein